MIRSMKAVQTLFFLLFFVIVQAGYAKNMTTKEIISILRPLEAKAIQYGDGDIKVYVFVDPKCPHSRDFISMIHDSQKMRGIYRYYIFFYELKRFHSHKLIGTIYASPSPLQKTLEVMVGGKEMDTSLSLTSQIEEKISDIERMAFKLEVNKRPYLIIAKEWD